MKYLHIVPGTGDISNGMVVVANMLAKEQGNAQVLDLLHGLDVVASFGADEIWVHGMWLPKEWAVCKRVLKQGKRLVRMTHGSLSPVYLMYQSPWKKRLVMPIEKWLLRHSDKIVATCEAESEWIRAYEPKAAHIEVTDLKRFFKLPIERIKPYQAYNFLYLGREHPLKGLEYLEEAVKGIEGVELRIVSNAFGEEKEQVWNWCDVLVLPTLSDNFGLVIAEALERGKRVITTDGAPAWEPEECEIVELWNCGNLKIWKCMKERMFYLKGYRDGTNEERVRLLRKAIEELACRS